MASIDKELNTSFQNDKHRFIANVIFTANWTQSRFSEFLKPFAISSQQFNVLRILRGAKDWVSMNEIKNLMIEKSPNATRLCDKLVEKSYVERKRSESDRRVVYLKISANGLKLLSGIDQAENPAMKFLNKLTEEEAKSISIILDRIRA